MNTIRNNDKTLVFDDYNLRGGFAQIPNTILRSSDLSANGKILYALLLSYAWRDKECFPGQDRLADNMGLKKLSVVRVLKELQSKKLIEIERRGQGKPNIYHIVKLSEGFISKICLDRGNNF